MYPSLNFHHTTKIQMYRLDLGGDTHAVKLRIEDKGGDALEINLFLEDTAVVVEEKEDE